eukprot:m.943788 g.943788  ORF g.943788 m.943788 type:complete len:61 (+) comp274705_c0_seq1:76-258(+)
MRPAVGLLIPIDEIASFSPFPRGDALVPSLALFPLILFLILSFACWCSFRHGLILDSFGE